LTWIRHLIIRFHLLLFDDQAGNARTAKDIFLGHVRKN
jgi:hypothetical protein